METPKIMYKGIENDKHVFVGLVSEPAPDIVSKIEHVATKRDGSGTIMISIEGHPIECKPGDIFPVPVGYEFKKEEKDGQTVLRITKIQ